MFVKPHPERTIRVHQCHQIVKGQVVGGEEVDKPLDVVHPHTRMPISREGIEVPEDVYWMRRLRDGDVVLAESPAPVSEIAAERAEPGGPAQPGPTHPEEPGA